MTVTSQWPTRSEHQSVRVVHLEYSDTHKFEVTEDTVLSISLAGELLEELGELPAFIEATKDQPGIVLNKHNMKVLKRLLNELDLD